MRTVKKWDDDLAIGIGLIDNQHKIIFDLINDLGNATLAMADKKVIDTLFDVIENYVFRHFEAEEELIAPHPSALEHSLEHYKLIKEFHKLRLGFRNRTNGENSVHEFLDSWFVRHISEHDVPLFDQIAKGSAVGQQEGRVDSYPSQEERRRHKRIQQKKITDHPILASCYNTSSLKSSQAEIGDISLGGIRFVAEEKHQVGDLLVIGCTIGKSFKMKEKARVVNTVDNSFGAEFIGLSPSTEKFLVELYGAVNIRNF
ncbi:MAG: hemerythrin domain-containing protein [Desulfobulbus sp.]